MFGILHAIMVAYVIAGRRQKLCIEVYVLPGVICDCRSENDDGSKPEQREENDRLRSFVRMRVKPSRTSEV